MSITVCRPPELEDPISSDAPDISWHWIKRRTHRWPQDWRCLKWDRVQEGYEGRWWDDHFVTAETMAEYGWTYHSVAWPPNVKFVDEGRGFWSVKDVLHV